MRTLYTIIYYLLIPFMLLRFLWRSRHTIGYRQRWHERFGYVPYSAGKDSLWIHAVSVGETLAAIPLIKAMIKRYGKDYRIIVTTTTPTGSALVSKQLDQSVTHFYAPFDTPTTLGRFLKRCRIKLCVVMETEIWPNLLGTCADKNIPVILTNARLSEKSYRGYNALGKFTRDLLSLYHAIAAQSVLDGERFLQLGLDPKKLFVSGNLKFDLAIPDAIITQGKTLRDQIGDRPVLIAASTHDGEESIILDAFKKLRETIPSLFLMIAPRHPDRFSKVFELCATQHYAVIRRSSQDNITSTTDVLLVDTIGELQMIYAAADIAFVGGSLVSTGGHNLIEPAALGIPVLTGPHLYNFTAISQLLQTAGAALVIHTADALAHTVCDLLLSHDLREKMGAAGKHVIDENLGALEKQLAVIAEGLLAPQV